MSGPTPGEWLVRHTNEKAPDIAYIQTGEGYLGGAQVAVIYYSEHSKANARLIAAAPDLLAALKAVVAISDRKHDAWDAAHAAIAKAESK